MTRSEGHPAGWEGYRKLGLVANPFETSGEREGETVGIELAARAAALRLIAAIEEASESERPRPVRVYKSSGLPTYYHISATSTLLRELGADNHMGVLPVYVPLIMMRKGRIRGTVSTLGEMVVGRSIDLTIAEYAHRALGEPDISLPEWEELRGIDVAPLVERFASAPEKTVADLFGPPDDVRPEGAPMAQVLRESGIRQLLQETDPSEDDETPEVTPGQADAAPGEYEGKTADAPPEDLEAVEEVDETPLAVVEYVVAHIKKNLSPVVARGLKAYVTDGTAAMAQELKVTRAPRKTLAALATLATHTFSRVVIIYDRFEGWSEIPEETRLDIVSGLTEIKFALGDRGVIVIAGGDESAPEIDEQFATAVRVDWDMPELATVQSPDAPADSEIMHKWLEEASLRGADLEGLRVRVEEATDGIEDLGSAAHAAAEAVEQAAGAVDLETLP